MRHGPTISGNDTGSRIGARFRSLVRDDERVSSLRRKPEPRVVVAGTIAFAFLALVPLAQDANAQTRSLLNGRDLTGWHVDVPADSTGKVGNPYSMRDGVLVVNGEPQGHLITDATYRNFRLEAEYRFTGKPGNAGILVHASTPRALYKQFPKSIEVQMESGNAGDFWCIVEDISVPDMERRRGPRATWGITEGKARRIQNLVDGAEKPVGEWNRMVIEVLDRSVKVWVNGTLANLGTQATADRGQIAIQSEGAPVEFRTLRLTPISALTP